MPVPNRGGSIAIQCEFKRIQQLRELRVSTPNVLAVSEKDILLQDIGIQHQSQIQQLDQALARRKEHAEKAFA